MSNPEVVGVLLAGGRAIRMGGGDKCLLPLAGRPLLAHVIERMAPQVGALVLNANGDPARFAGFGLPVVADTFPGFQGPLAGLLAGMRWAETRGATSIATAAADTPFFPRNHVERLLTASKPVAVARSGGRIHPLFSLVPVALAGDLEDFLGRQASRKVTDWLERAWSGCDRSRRRRRRPGRPVLQCQHGGGPGQSGGGCTIDGIARNVRMVGRWRCFRLARTGASRNPDRNRHA